MGTMQQIGPAGAGPIEQAIVQTRDVLVAVVRNEAGLASRRDMRLPRGLALAGGQLFDIVANHGQPVLIHQVGFGQRHQSGANIQQPANIKVLARLRHHALVRGNDQESRIDAARTREHVADKTFVAGHIYEFQDGTIRA